MICRKKIKILSAVFRVSALVLLVVFLIVR